MTVTAWSRTFWHRISTHATWKSNLARGSGISQWDLRSTDKEEVRLPSHLFLNMLRFLCPCPSFSPPRPPCHIPFLYAPSPWPGIKHLMVDLYCFFPLQQRELDQSNPSDHRVSDRLSDHLSNRPLDLLSDRPSNHQVGFLCLLLITKHLLLCTQ